MNIITEEYDSPVMAKTCGCKSNKRKVTYSFLNESHSLCLDRKDLMNAQLEACSKLIRYATDEEDKNAVEKEINELKMALDLMT
ncbi:MAG TPA: hypothetical protein VD736_01560 [Nitrososphaera sp.]|nr:hypothetical protein [Nitrososphaera sp.]